MPGRSEFAIGVQKQLQDLRRFLGELRAEIAKCDPSILQWARSFINDLQRFTLHVQPKTRGEVDAHDAAMHLASGLCTLLGFIIENTKSRKLRRSLVGRMSMPDRMAVTARRGARVTRTRRAGPIAERRRLLRDQWPNLRESERTYLAAVLAAAEHFKVSERTIARDLSEIGIRDIC